MRSQISIAPWITRAWKSFNGNRAMIFGLILVIAALAMELSNYLSTRIALDDIMGFAAMSIFGYIVRWSAVLSVGFVLVDIAGLARIFTPETGRHEPKEVWILFAVWLFAAIADAVLTWWSVSLAMMASPSAMSFRYPAFNQVVPVAVAVTELGIRVSLINTLAVWGDRLFTAKPSGASPASRPNAPSNRPSPQPLRPSNLPRPASSFGARPTSAPGAPRSDRPSVPTYHPVNPDEKRNFFRD